MLARVIDFCKAILWLAVGLLAIAIIAGALIFGAMIIGALVTLGVSLVLGACVYYFIQEWFEGPSKRP